VVWLLLVLAAVIALAAGILAARSLARRVVRPMEAMTLAAQALGEGDFTARTDSTGIPELDRAGTALNSTAERLNELVQRERQLAAYASHQLRTPLTGLRLVLERAEAAPDADLKSVLSHAIAGADRLDQTIDELITLHRGGVPGTPLDVGLQLDAAALRWHGVLAASGRPLRVDADPRVPSASAVQSALQQILDALIENAVKHGSGEVTLRSRDAHGAVAIDVEDEGSGLADSDEIFDPAFSGNGGSGLGLALARQLVKDQGGRLLLSERNPHTRFTVLLPITSAATGVS
jgi:signal transduction histidine kinase